MIQDRFIKMFIKQYKQPAFVDEVGFGSLFGPMVACAVIIPKSFRMNKVNDSKQLKHKEIYKLAPKLKERVIYSLGIIKSDELNEIRNIYKADLLAIEKAIISLPKKPDAIFIDGRFIPKNVNIPIHTIVKGDTKVFGIAVASIIAKDYRDHLVMSEFGEKFAIYDINNNKGYRSPKHLEAIKRNGITKFHRNWLPEVKRAFDIYVTTLSANIKINKKGARPSSALKGAGL